MKCTKCNGTGHVWEIFNDPDAEYESKVLSAIGVSTKIKFSKTCSKCKGRGKTKE